MSSKQPLNVAIFGAGGNNIGHYLVKALVSKPDLFNVTIIARKSSKSSFPEGAKVQYVDDEIPKDQVVVALQGQDAVVSAIGFEGKPKEKVLIEAAIEAKVKRFLPSEYGLNNLNPAARKLCPVFELKGEIIELLKEKEAQGLTWTSVATGLWLDWCLNPQIAFAGINIEKHTATLWGNGTHTSSWTTLEYAAEAVATVLLHPEVTTNKIVPIRAFEASQRDILDLFEKAQNTKYEITTLDPEPTIAAAQKSWAEKQDPYAVFTLIQAGFLNHGYGSDLVGEGVVPVANEYLSLPSLDLQTVVDNALKSSA